MSWTGGWKAFAECEEESRVALQTNFSREERRDQALFLCDETEPGSRDIGVHCPLALTIMLQKVVGNCSEAAGRSGFGDDIRINTIPPLSVEMVLFFGHWSPPSPPTFEGRGRGAFNKALEGCSTVLYDI
jgi:hypothetical protein